MTRYTVTATQKAENDLADLWLRAANRTAVAVAADRIDRILREDASVKGCPATHGLRQIVVAPLMAEFSVEEDDRQVTIWTIRHIGELVNGH
jgi:plasmid stabilization system protein ParE